MLYYVLIIHGIDVYKNKVRFLSPGGFGVEGDLDFSSFALILELLNLKRTRSMYDLEIARFRARSMG